MSDLLPAAKAIEELEPAVQAFAEATGALGPVRELAAWATDLIRYRRAPYQARLLMKAAEKIKASGLPPRAVEDKILRAVLEDGAMEDDPGMQDRWANLLANAGTGTASVRAAFPNILRDLDPADAAILEEFAGRTSAEQFLVDKFTTTLDKRDGVSLGNLTRLELLRDIRSMPTTLGTISDREATVDGTVFTEFGWAFVQACQEPLAAD
jgi:hypothetical protein